MQEERIWLPELQVLVEEHAIIGDLSVPIRVVHKGPGRLPAREVSAVPASAVRLNIRVEASFDIEPHSTPPR